MHLVVTASFLAASCAADRHLNWPTDFVFGTYLLDSYINPHRFPWDAPAVETIFVQFPQLPVDVTLFKPAILGIASLTVQAVAHVSTSGGCKWNALPPHDARASAPLTWGPQFTNCTETAFTGNSTTATTYSITVHNNNKLETLHYGLALFFGCASGFPVDNSLCSPVRLLPKGVYTSACAYNTSGQVFTGTHGCGCSKATGNFLGCWDGSDASAAPPVCQTVFSPNVVGCSDCKTVCPQP